MKSIFCVAVLCIPNDIKLSFILAIVAYFGALCHFPPTLGDFSACFDPWQKNDAIIFCQGSKQAEIIFLIIVFVGISLFFAKNRLIPTNTMIN